MWVASYCRYYSKEEEEEQGVEKQEPSGRVNQMKIGVQEEYRLLARHNQFICLLEKCFNTFTFSLMASSRFLNPSSTSSSRYGS